MVAGYAAVERQTAGMPPWVASAGILANLVLWLGVLGPVATRRFERRFPLGREVRPASRRTEGNSGEGRDGYAADCGTANAEWRRTW